MVSQIASCLLYSRQRGLLSPLSGPASGPGYGSRPLCLLVSCQHLAWLRAPPSSSSSGLAHCWQVCLLCTFHPFPATILLCGTECVLHPQEREEQDLGFTGTPCLLHDIALLGTVCRPTPSGLLSLKLHTLTGGCSRVNWGLDTLTFHAAVCTGFLLQTYQDCQHTGCSVNGWLDTQVPMAVKAYLTSPLKGP